MSDHTNDPYQRLRLPPGTEPDDLCHCLGFPAVKLMCALTYNPLYCLDCNLEVDPASLHLPVYLGEPIATWRSDYDAIYRLSLACGDSRCGLLHNCRISQAQSMLTVFGCVHNSHPYDHATCGIFKISQLILLIDIIAVAICAVIWGADSWVAVETFGKAKHAWLEQYLGLPNGIPSHDPFGRVFASWMPSNFNRMS